MLYNGTGCTDKTALKTKNISPKASIDPNLLTLMETLNDSGV